MAYAQTQALVGGHKLSVQPLHLTCMTARPFVSRTHQQHSSIHRHNAASRRNRFTQTLRASVGPGQSNTVQTAWCTQKTCLCSSYAQESLSQNVPTGQGLGLSPELHAAIDKFIAENKIVLFMKGNRMFPQCGFSNTCVQVVVWHMWATNATHLTVLQQSLCGKCRFSIHWRFRMRQSTYWKMSCYDQA